MGRSRWGLGQMNEPDLRTAAVAAAVIRVVGCLLGVARTDRSIPAAFWTSDVTCVDIVLS